jgi:hypothetical protein
MATPYTNDKTGNACREEDDMCPVDPCYQPEMSDDDCYQPEYCDDGGGRMLLPSQPPQQQQQQQQQQQPARGVLTVPKNNNTTTTTTTTPVGGRCIRGAVGTELRPSFRKEIAVQLRYSAADPSTTTSDGTPCLLWTAPTNKFWSTHLAVISPSGKRLTPHKNKLLIESITASVDNRSPVSFALSAEPLASSNGGHTGGEDGDFSGAHGLFAFADDKTKASLLNNADILDTPVQYKFPYSREHVEEFETLGKHDSFFTLSSKSPVWDAMQQSGRFNNYGALFDAVATQRERANMSLPTSPIVGLDLDTYTQFKEELLGTQNTADAHFTDISDFRFTLVRADGLGWAATPAHFSCVPRLDGGASDAEDFQNKSYPINVRLVFSGAYEE